MAQLSVDTSAIKANLKAHRYVYLLIAALLLFNLPSLNQLVAGWAADGNYSHGFLIVPISIWLFWRQRQELQFPARTSPEG